MCNFHEAVAEIAATDPVTGKVHRGRKTVIRIALSRYWAERYVEAADTISGYNPYPMATKAQQESFKRSGLDRPLALIESDENAAYAHLRQKIDELSRHQDLSEKALNLPILPAQESFIDMATEELYEGDPKGDYRVKEKSPSRDLEPLHRAIAFLHADPQNAHHLEQLIKTSVARLYRDAPLKVNRSLIELYEALPPSAKDAAAKAGHYGGSILMGGFAGLAGHSLHYGAVLGAGFASGMASSANIALSGAFMAASYGGWHEIFGGKYRAAKEKLSAFSVQAGLTLAIAFGAQGLFEHDHMSNEKMIWFTSLPETMRSEIIGQTRATYNRLPEKLRERLDIAAADLGILPEIFIITCSGEDPISRDITAFLTAQNIEKSGKNDLSLSLPMQKAAP